MPSRRRPKEGLHRMDAAFSVLCQMGFDRTLVRKTVNSLLKVYGGIEGWSFVEDSCYKVVVDTLLEEQEKDEQKLVEGSTSEVESLGQSDNPNTQLQDEPLDNQIVPADSNENSQKFPEKSPKESQHTNNDAPVDNVRRQTRASLKDKEAAEQHTNSNPPVDNIRRRNRASLKDKTAADQRTNPDAPVDNVRCRTRGSLKDKAAADQHINSDAPVNNARRRTRASLEDKAAAEQHTNSDAPVANVPRRTRSSLKKKAAAEKRTPLLLPNVECPPGSSGPVKKRRPCYGWITWEDEEEADAYLSQAS